MAGEQSGSAGRPRRERINPPGVHKPGGNYSHVSRVGNTLYISGQIGIDPDGNVVGKGDPTAQAEQIYKNLETIVKYFGGTMGNIEKITTYITNWGWRAPVGQVRDRYYPTNPPASTLVVISALASPDLLVEIEAIAVLDD